MPTNPDPITLFQVVQRAVDIVDPDDSDPTMGDLLLRFEDAEEPVTAVGDIDSEVADALEELDPAGANPAVMVAGAMILYLARRRDELGAEPVDILRLAARAEWHGEPPAVVEEWLADRGVEG